MQNPEYWHLVHIQTLRPLDIQTTCTFISSAASLLLAALHTLRAVHAKDWPRSGVTMRETCRTWRDLRFATSMMVWVSMSLKYRRTT